MINKQVLAEFAKYMKSDSFIHQMVTDIYVIKVFVSTYGLGVGLGFDRSLSLITTLMITS